MKHFSRAFSLWLPPAIAITGIFAFNYLAVQQNYRQSANDPQIQIAEDAAQLITQSGAPASAISRGATPTNIATSLAAWVAVYDAGGMPLEASAVLDGSPPRLPTSLFDSSTWLPSKTYNFNGLTETRITWQPREGVRQAVVLVKMGNGQFVASGRSLREVENREDALTHVTALLWGATEITTLLAVGILLAIKSPACAGLVS